MLSDTLKELRLNHGLSQRKMAKHLNVTQGAISQWETGLTRPDTDMLIRISQEFGVSLDDLTKGEIEETKEFISRRPITDEELKFALWGSDAPNVTDSQFEQVKQFAKFIRQKGE